MPSRAATPFEPHSPLHRLARSATRSSQARLRRLRRGLRGRTTSSSGGRGAQGHRRARRRPSGRVVREVEAARALDHPGIVALLDFFSDGRRSFLVWELVRGQSLAELDGELRDDEAVLAARSSRRPGLRPRQGVVHRDVKPQNVMIDERRRRQGHGLRHRPPGRRRHADRRGRAAGHGRLHVARAGGRPPRRPADRRLLGRRAALRAARRRQPGARRHRRRDLRQHPRRPHRPPRAAAPRPAARALRRRWPPPARSAAAERPSAAAMADELRALSGRLGGGRHLRPQRLLAPLRRLEVVATRGLGAALAAAGLAPCSPGCRPTRRAGP